MVRLEAEGQFFYVKGTGKFHQEFSLEVALRAIDEYGSPPERLAAAREEEIIAMRFLATSAAVQAATKLGCLGFGRDSFLFPDASEVNIVRKRKNGRGGFTKGLPQSDAAKKLEAIDLPWPLSTNEVFLLNEEAWCERLHAEDNRSDFSTVSYVFNMDAILIHPHELVLKGRNRSLFLYCLIKNIRCAIKDLGMARMKRLGAGTILLTPCARDAKEEMLRRLALIPGIANLMPVYETAPTLGACKKRMTKELSLQTMRSFRITARRSDKSFPLTSLELQRDLGAWVQEKTNAVVDLFNPEFNIFVEVFGDRMLFGFEKTQGQGGLPVGTSGSVLALLSGGIDSPVASWMMMRRGCRVSFAHFHAYPYVSKRSQEKAKKLARLLSRHQGSCVLYFVPFGEAQREILLACPSRFRVLLYRRFMMRIASGIAKKEGALALVTGENLGQVASQTLENISVIEGVSSLAVLRPLIGMHKDEIVTYARRIGTYETSCMPDEDCCQLFMPSYPATRAFSHMLEKAEEKIDCESLVSQAIASVEKQKISFFA